MSETDRHRAPPWLKLDRDEAIRFRAAPSKNLLLGGVAVGFAILVAGSVAVSAVGDVRTGRLVSGAMLAVILALLAGTYVVTARREYVLTSKRACERVGLTGTTVTEVELDRVANVALEQPAWQRWLGVGSLELVTDGRDAGVQFSYVDEPRRAFERVAEYVTSA